MFLNGGMGVKRRAHTLKAFRESKKSEVLVISSIGVTGLNLDCANIVIVHVSHNASSRLISH